MQSTRRTAAFLCLLTTFLAPPVAATGDDPSSTQVDDDEPLVAQFRDLFKNEFFELGSLIQTGARYSESRSGFSLGTARLNVEGSLDDGFNYKLQTDFVGSPALKDALIGYHPSATVGFTGGRYKTPFSYEELTSSSATLFINRSRVVRLLAPGRQIGAHVTGGLSSTVDLHAGVYNGNNANLGENNNRFLYVGRLESSSENQRGTIVLGANAAYNDESPVGDKTLIGADFHIQRDAFLVSGEAIYGRHDNPDRRFPPTTLHPFGHHLTVGYTVPTTDTFNQLLLRWDRYTPGRELSTASNQFVFGYTAEPTSVIRVEANYVLPVTNDGAHQAMLQVQLAL